jgi:hypothetical protein
MSDESDDRKSDGLGSLAQSARQSSLKQARVILILVGVLTLAVNLVLFLNIENEVQDLRRQHPGIVIPQDAIQTARLIYGGTAALGGVFIVLGIAVYAAPVVCTVIGLVLYLGGFAVFAVLDPENIHRGIIIKILIIVGLIKAVQAAAAYEREAKAERAASRDEYES